MEDEEKRTEQDVSRPGARPSRAVGRNASPRPAPTSKRETTTPPRPHSDTPDAPLRQRIRAARKKAPEDRAAREVAGILAITLGPLAVHKFVMGYRSEGVLMLIGSMLTLGLATSLIAFIEAVIYFRMTDEEFRQTYIENRRGWF